MRPPLPVGTAGFSLIELLLALTILAIVSLIALPAFSEIRNMAKTVRAVTEIRELERVVNGYAIDHSGVFPTTWAQMGIAVPLDPWQQPYVISAPSRIEIGTLNEDFDLYSIGPDGRTHLDIFEPESHDDIVRTGNGGFVGAVKNFPTFIP